MLSFRVLQRPPFHALVAGRSCASSRLAVAHRATLFESRLEIYVISDLHTDYAENMAWVEALAMGGGQQWPVMEKSAESSISWEEVAFRSDKPATLALNPIDVQRVLLVAGDISDCLVTLEQTFRLLLSCFWKVVFIPGNHELWVTGPSERHGGAKDSVQKLEKVMKLCRSLGVQVSPCKIGPHLRIVPLHSWHHKSFDQEADIPGVPRAGSMTIADYAKCIWPESVSGPEVQGGLQLAQWADRLNDDTLLEGNSGCDVISFSHFIPDQRLMPEKRYLSYPNLMKAVGSEPLGIRVRKLQPLIHCFGHSHFAWDAHLECPPCSSGERRAVRYIQAPLAYPLERRRRLRSLVLKSVWHKDIAPGGSQVQAADGHSHLPLLLYKAKYRVSVSEEASVPSHDRSLQNESLEGTLSGATHLPDLLTSLWRMHLSHASGPGERTMSSLCTSSNSGREAGNGTVRPYGAIRLPLSSAEDGEQFSVVIDQWVGEAVPRLTGAMWSDHYERHPRDPNNVELAPWVAPRYARRRVGEAAPAAASSSPLTVRPPMTTKGS